MGKIHAAALEHIAFFDHARDTAAAFLPLPGIGDEGLAIDFFKRGHDAGMQVQQVGFDSGCGMGGWSCHWFTQKKGKWYEL